MLIVAFSGAVQDPATVSHFASQGMIAASTSADALAEFVRDQIQLWGHLVKETGLSPQ